MGEAAAGGSTTPGDGLGLLLPLGPELEETTTPELEQIGMASQEGGIQQQQQQQQLMLPAVAGAAAAGAAGGSSGGGRVAGLLPGSRGAAAAAAGGGNGAGGLPGSSGRGSRGAGVVCEEVTTKQTLFPIFRPKSQRKCLILVRHGESSEWLLCGAGVPCWGVDRGVPCSNLQLETRCSIYRMLGDAEIDRMCNAWGLRVCNAWCVFGGGGYSSGTS